MNSLARRLTGGLKLEIIRPEDDPEWDRFVHQHPLGWLYHLSAWQRVLESSYPHIRGQILALYSADGRTLRAALPLYEVRSRLCGHRRVSVPFATRCDPLVGNAEEFSLLLDAVLDQSSRERAARFRISVSSDSPWLRDPRLQRQIRHTGHVIFLDRHPEELLYRMHKNAVRRPLKKAAASGLRIEEAQGESDLGVFYQLYVRTRRRLGLPPQPYEFLSSIWRELGASGLAQLLLARLERRTVAGTLLLKYKDRVLAEIGAADPRLPSLPAQHLLDWHAINMAYREGYSYYDLGRCSIQNPGLALFKRRWGSVEIPLPVHTYNEREKVSQWSTIYRGGRRLCRLLPLQILEICGRFCYRHMG